MAQVTHTELQNLIDNSGLTAGEIYVVTDYPNYNLAITAVSENELEDEAYNYAARDSLVFHYVPSTNTVDYMKDTYRKIEANFDWTDNITGNCSDIHLGDCTELYVEDCIGVYCHGVSSGTIANSQNIVVMEGNVLDIDGTNNITIGKDNTLVISDSENLDIGDSNTLTFSDIDAISVGDNNYDIVVTDGVNIIGSNNRMINITGDSNVIKSDNIDIELAGCCNSMDRTKYLRAYGSYNTTDKTTLAVLDTAYANEVRNSHSVNVKNTNNNIVRTDSIEIKDKPAFVQYATTGSCTRVENLTQRTNMQADATATTLIVDQEKMWNTSDTKANKHYVIEDGVWVNTEE